MTCWYPAFSPTPGVLNHRRPEGFRDSADFRHPKVFHCLEGFHHPEVLRYSGGFHFEGFRRPEGYRHLEGLRYSEGLLPEDLIPEGLLPGGLLPGGFRRSEDFRHPVAFRRYRKARCPLPALPTSSPSSQAGSRNHPCSVCTARRYSCASLHNYPDTWPARLRLSRCHGGSQSGQCRHSPKWGCRKVVACRS